MTGRDDLNAFHKMPYTLGLMYHSQWLELQNERRQLAAFDKIDEIRPVASFGAEDEGRLTV